MAMTTVNNGVNVQALLDAREALKGAPEAAKFTWRASCKWQNGTHSKTKVQSFFGLGQEQQHKTETSCEADHPEVFASEDHAITPIEYVLVGLASCLTAGVAAVAQNRGIQLRSVESNLEGRMDIRGILGIDSDVRNGYDDVKVTFTGLVMTSYTAERFCDGATIASLSFFGASASILNFTLMSS